MQVASHKVCSHELLHLLGFDHCIYFCCLMNGSGHLAEDLRQPHHLCPVCGAKLRSLVAPEEEQERWERERYSALLPLYLQLELEAEASWCRRRTTEDLGS